MTILSRFETYFLAKKRGWFLWPFYQGFSLTFKLKKEGDFYDHFTKVIALLLS